jgi:hypothetical protein
MFIHDLKTEDNFCSDAWQNVGLVVGMHTGCSVVESWG